MSARIPWGAVNPSGVGGALRWSDPRDVLLGVQVIRQPGDLSWTNVLGPRDAEQLGELEPAGFPLGVRAAVRLRLCGDLCTHVHTSIVAWRYHDIRSPHDTVMWHHDVMLSFTGRERAMRRTLPGHVNCRHRYYGLSCAVYEQLLGESGQRCALCAAEASSNTAGKLFVDHDSAVGLWAVRGLLCHRCNSLLAEKPGWTVIPPESFHAYLEDPWYIRRANELGVSLSTPAEPSRSALVRDAHGRVWQHTWMGWRCADGRARGRDWDWLVAQFGPIGLTISNSPNT